MRPRRRRLLRHCRRRTRRRRRPAGDLADAFGAAAAPQASPKASTELDSAFGAPQAAADDVNGTPSTDNASPGTTLSAREAALPTPDAADFLTSAMPDAAGADALFSADAAPTTAAEEQEQLERALAASRQDVDAAFSESSENLAAAFGAAPSPKASAEPTAPSPKASGDLADAFGAASAPQASAELDSAFGAAPAEPTPKKAYLLDRIATSDGFKNAPSHQLDDAFGAAPSPDLGRRLRRGVGASPERVRRPGRGGGGAGGLAGRTLARDVGHVRRAATTPPSGRRGRPARPRRRRRPPSQSRKVIWREGDDGPTSACTISTWRRATAPRHKPDAPYKPLRRGRRVDGVEAAAGGRRGSWGVRRVLPTLLLSSRVRADGGGRVPRLSQQHTLLFGLNRTASEPPQNNVPVRERGKRTRIRFYIG